jgi:hypothetical protein
VEERATVAENYKLMQLYSPSLSAQSKQVVAETLSGFNPELNKTGIRKMLIQDGMGEIQLSGLFQNFSRMIFDLKRGRS